MSLPTTPRVNSSMLANYVGQPVRFVGKIVEVCFRIYFRDVDITRTQGANVYIRNKAKRDQCDQEVEWRTDNPQTNAAAFDCASVMTILRCSGTNGGKAREKRIFFSSHFATK